MVNKSFEMYKCLMYSNSGSIVKQRIVMIGYESPGYWRDNKRIILFVKSLTTSVKSKCSESFTRGSIVMDKN